MVISNLLALASWIWRSRDTLLFPTPNFSILFAASLVLCPLRTNLGIETDLFAVKKITLFFSLVILKLVRCTTAVLLISVLESSVITVQVSCRRARLLHDFYKIV